MAGRTTAAGRRRAAAGAARRSRTTAATPGRGATGPDPQVVARFVEHVAMVYEGLGLPKMAGRIVGHLLVCDPPHQSMSELQSALGASKGSISTMTRMLVAATVIERVPVAHDRREYVRIPPLAFDRMMNSAVERTRAVRQLAEEGLEALAGAPAARTERLRAMRDFYAFMERQIPKSIARYRRERLQAAKKR